MYNIINTYDHFKNILLISRDVKIKLLELGILYNTQYLTSLSNFLDPSIYLIDKIVIHRDAVIHIKPKINIDKDQIRSDLSLALYNYINSFGDILQHNLNNKELAFCSNSNYVKLLYSLESYNIGYSIKI